MYNDKIILKMLQELSGFNHINSSVIDSCYISVCKYYGLEGDREFVIQRVNEGLNKIFS